MKKHENNNLYKSAWPVVFICQYTWFSGFKDNHLPKLPSNKRKKKKHSKEIYLCIRI